MRVCHKQTPMKRASPYKCKFICFLPKGYWFRLHLCNLEISGNFEKALGDEKKMHSKPTQIIEN